MSMATTLNSTSIEVLPASPPPPGIQPNFIDPPSRAYQVYITAGVCLPLILLFATTRFYVSAFLLKSRSRADYAWIVGLAAGITYIGLTIATVSGGVLGKHQWDYLLVQWSVEKLRLSLLNEAIYGPLIWLVKLSIFLMLLELFGLLTWLRLSVWAGIVLTGAFYFSYLVTILTLCAPRGSQTQLAYLQSLTSLKCAAHNYLFLPVGIMNVVSDVYLMVIPLPAIWGLQLPLMKKVGVSAIFLTGFM